MKRKSLLLTFFFISLLTISSTVQAGWLQVYGTSGNDYGKWIDVTSEGGYVIAGSITPGEDDERMYVIKTDSLGDTLWTWRYPPDTAQEKQPINWSMCIQQTFDRGYIVAAQSVLPSPLALWLIKLDSLGNNQWSVPDDDNMGRADCVRQTPDGGYVVVGKKMEPPPSVRYDVWLVKVDANGSIVWNRTYGTGNAEMGYGLAVTEDSGFIITGYNDYDVWLLKTDPLGDTLWTKRYGLGDPELGEKGYCVELTSDGGYIVGGLTDGISPFTGALLLLKTDSEGDTLWTRVYDYGEQEESANSVKETPDGGYIVVGVKNRSMAFQQGDLWLLRTNAYGDTLWTRTFGAEWGSDEGRCVQLTGDGGYIITGMTEYFAQYGKHDILLIKTDSLGYVPIVEDQIEVETSVDTSAPLGKPVEIRYTNMPGGFHAYVFDVTGRKVSEIHNPASSGTVSWGEGHQPGVYFIRPLTDGAQARKVIITR